MEGEFLAYRLPSYTSVLFQTLDVAAFGQFKVYLRNFIAELGRSYEFCELHHFDFFT